MNKQPTFSVIESFSELIEDNDFFMQYTNQALPNHYDANFVWLKYNPTLSEFKLIESLHNDYQQAINQNHLQFYWPENTGVFIEVLNYLNEETYEIGMQELLHLNLKNFTTNKQAANIHLEFVTKQTLLTFLNLNHKEDLALGKSYAQHKEDVYRYQFQEPHVKFLLALIDGRPVGSLIIISSTNYLEIYNVLTDQDFRKQGIAASMIAHVVNEARQEQKTIILVADAEDTPKEMYKKMGFETIATQIQAQKTDKY
jgi:predicted GNAT family acetyltransferase